ncbi:MAG: thioredoxin family protein [Chlorobi bacterium]|nr:thioredoxin family protein [Chlorobiota bacterium]
MRCRTLIFVVFILMLSVSCSFELQGQNKMVFSKKAGQEILLGKGDVKGLEQQPFKQWFQQEYNSYVPDKHIVRKLKRNITDELKVLIVMATWCSDSRREVPRFYKIADAAGIPEDNIEIIYVDRDKTAPDVDVSKYGIERVPTFIFIVKGREAGRIVETPEKSLEKDMFLILRGVEKKK